MTGIEEILQQQEEGEVIDAPPETTDHIPVPTVGVFVKRVATVVPQIV